MISDLPARVLEMCKARNWSLHWTARGAYLHLESSELIEVVRGKNLKGFTRESRIRDEAADVLMVLQSITESNGVAWDDVEAQASKRTDELMETADTPYAGEQRG